MPTVDSASARRGATRRGDAIDAPCGCSSGRKPGYTWVGIYLLDGDELVLGPFVGKPSPHTRIPLGRGICGAAATEKATIIVDDVNADPRYLACSLETKSEIVVPIMLAGRGPRRDRHRQRSARGVRRCRPRAARESRGAPRPARAQGAPKAGPLMSHVITLIPGDGIGPEVTEAVVRIFKVAGLDVAVGAPRRRRHGLQALQPVAAASSCSIRSARTRSRSRGRSRRPSAKGSPASTSGCARRSISTPTCGR